MLKKLNHMKIQTNHKMLVQVTLKNNLLYKLDYFKIKYKGLHTRSATISTANQAKSEVIRLRFVGCSHEHEHIIRVSYENGFEENRPQIFQNRQRLCSKVQHLLIRLKPVLQVALPLHESTPANTFVQNYRPDFSSIMIKVLLLYVHGCS